MKILITGINGFVGVHLSQLLLNRKDRIYGLFRNFNKRKQFQKKRGIHWIDCDILNEKKLRRTIQNIRPKIIFHLAAQSSGALSFKQPGETFKANVLGSIHLLESVRRAGFSCKILLPGSSEVYGKVQLKEGERIREDDQLSPVNPYGVSKWEVEKLGELYGRLYGLQIYRTRSFNHIGPGQSTQFSIPNFCRQVALIKNGKLNAELRVGNLNVWRDFLDVRDVVRAYVRIIEKGKAGEIYNVCSGKSYWLKEILKSLIDLAGVKVKIIQDRALLRPVDIPVMRGDPRKLERHTGWRPGLELKTTLKDILKEWLKK